ncbi:MAG: carboxypeptidase regulatory-like domain-containing protein [Euryarchaeota archaeon]|nr:carboxypeptidase regulatory-like domain-containing protein [Euryarchaeota archaeon]
MIIPEVPKPKLYLAIVCIIICLTVVAGYLLLCGCSEYVWLEAEDADTLTPGFVIVKGPLASGGEYLLIPKGSGRSSRTGVAEYTIYINTSGDYVIWSRAIAPTGEGNALVVQIDDAIGAIHLSRTWQWATVNHRGSTAESNPTNKPLSFRLAAGKHTLKLKPGGSAAKLDKMLITNDKSYVPVERVGAISGTVITAKEAGIADATVTLTTWAQDELAVTTSDNNGNYAFNDVPQGYYILTASKPLFLTDSDSVIVKAGEETTADIMLGMNSKTEANI